MVDIAMMRRSRQLLTLLAFTMLTVTACDALAEEQLDPLLSDGMIDLFARPPNGVLGIVHDADETTPIGPLTVERLSPLDAVEDLDLADTAAAAAPPDPGELLAAADTGTMVGIGPLRTYEVVVERGTGVDPDEFAAIVERVLADERSWIADGSVSFQRVAAGGSFRVLLARPLTVDRLCLPLRTLSQLSCRTSAGINLNLTRWLVGTPDFASIDDYRAYLVNHEVGHVLGHGHRGCPAPGRLAPVMMQQSKSVGSCVANGWPNP